MFDKPVIFQWDAADRIMRPATPQQAAVADALFVDGHNHALIEYLPRDWNSHGHYFARLREMWNNWPEAAGEPFATTEHLRKHALISTGWHDKAEWVFRTAADATLAAAILMPIDTYAVVEVNGPRLTRWTAKSQNSASMGKQEFQKSKWQVLNWVADIIRLPPDDIHRSED